jgi:RNase P/RNase MRP subunit p29
MWRCDEMNMYNQPWIGRSLVVVDSTDATLLGRNGTVVNESRNTVSLLEGERTLVLNKASITFTVGDSDVAIEGAMVSQRPEDRIHRTYRKA